MSNRNDIRNVTFDKIKVVATATFTRTLSLPEIELLALVSGDVDPFHIEQAGSADSRADSNTIDGAAAAALISIAIGTKLPGPGMHIRRQALSFQGEISTGDTLEATVVVARKIEENSEVILDCRCVNQGGLELVTGNVTVTAPRLSTTYSEMVPPQITVRRSDEFVKLLQSLCKDSACSMRHSLSLRTTIHFWDPSKLLRGESFDRSWLVLRTAYARLLGPLVLTSVRIG